VLLRSLDGQGVGCAMLIRTPDASYGHDSMRGCRCLPGAQTSFVVCIVPISENSSVISKKKKKTGYMELKLHLLYVLCVSPCDILYVL
jgi:hypothetical protein